ncbi:MAG: ribbon-helix-helix domain-containing protein [Candidatus Woesearchaeota archaeon]
MSTEMITMKLDSRFLKEIDDVVKAGAYQSRTEFIRNALREKVDEAKLKEAMRSIAHLRGAAKTKTTEEEYERHREEAFEEISRRLKRVPRV